MTKSVECDRFVVVCSLATIIDYKDGRDLFVCHLMKQRSLLRTEVCELSAVTLTIKGDAEVTTGTQNIHDRALLHLFQLLLSTK